MPPLMTTIPTITLNGTGGKTLWKEYHAAYKAIGSAIDTLCEATCNGRDFNDWETFYKARDERTEALEKLRATKSYVEEILMGIMAQQG
jgi:hypothetical protein